MTEAIFTLKDYRKMSYAIYGPANGKPVLYFHGTPSSRKEILLLKIFGVDLEDMLAQAGLCIIVPDRHSLTTFYPQRTFISFADDTVQLLDHLHINKCAVLCWSGGGPYALAMAYCYPRIVENVNILTGITKSMDKLVMQQMGLNKWFFLLAKNAPLFLRFALTINRDRKITKLPPQKFTGLPNVDYNMLKKTITEAAACTLQEAIRKGTKSVIHEARLYFEPFGFSVKDIRQPIHYWWGTKDMNVIELHAREVEQSAKNAVMHYREGEGHLSLYIKCFAEALQAIVQQQY